MSLTQSHQTSSQATAQASTTSSNQAVGATNSAKLAGLPATGPDPAAISAQLAKAREILDDPDAPLSEDEKKRLSIAISTAESKLAAYQEVQDQGSASQAIQGGLVIAGTALVADDATVVGTLDDPLLILVGLGLLATALLARPPASSQDLGQAWRDLGNALQRVAELGTTLVALRLKGDKLRGNTKQLAAHLARLLGLAVVGGVPSGEPPDPGGDNDPHWWKEIKAFLKNIRDAYGKASRKQVMRELKKKFSEEQIDDILQRLIEAAKKMGDEPPTFLP